MDACAVSVSNGICYHCNRKQTFFTSLSFGFFQGFMPLLGFLAGRTFERFITNVDHWLALILLGFIGGKMFFEALKDIRMGGASCPAPKELTLSTLLVQSIATSIDALAVGISFAALKVNIGLAVIFIGLITFAVCLFGSALGKRFGILLKSKAELLGGAILIFIGVKIFIEHTLGL